MILRTSVGIAAVLALGMIATHAAPTRARACAIAWPIDQVVGIGAEEALIVWDGERRIQHFVRRAAFQGAPDDFGFLVPTPTQPELAEAGDGIFARLETATARQIEHRTNWVLSTCCLSTLTAFLFTRGGEPDAIAVSAAPDVVVLAEQRVAGLDAAILSASDPEALGRWLGEHGYATRPALTEWVAPYVEQGWIVTAFKIAKGDTSADRIRSRAVRMSFSAERPFYPYREPSDSRIEGTRDLRIWFVGPGRFEGRLENGAAWPAEVRFSRARAGFRALLGDAVPAEVIPEGAWLTDFVDRHHERPPGGDLVFRRAREDTEVVPPPFIVEDDTPLPLPIEPILFGVWIWLVVRWQRNKRRRAAQGTTGSPPAQDGGSGSTSRT